MKHHFILSAYLNSFIIVVKPRLIWCNLALIRLLFMMKMMKLFKMKVMVQALITVSDDDSYDDWHLQMMTSVGQSTPAPTTVTTPRGSLPAPVPQGTSLGWTAEPVRIWTSVAGTMVGVGLRRSVLTRRARSTAPQFVRRATAGIRTCSV